MKFEGAEGKLSLLLKNNIIYIQKFSCQQLICTYNYYRQLKSLTFQLKEISNTCIFKHTHRWFSSCIPYLRERGKKVSKKCT